MDFRCAADRSVPARRTLWIRVFWETIRNDERYRGRGGAKLKLYTVTSKFIYGVYIYVHSIKITFGRMHTHARARARPYTQFDLF